MHNRAAVQDPHTQPFLLDPIDQHVLDTAGELPGLPLLINPELLRRLRGLPPSVHTLETTGRDSSIAVDQEAYEDSKGVSTNFPPREDYTFRGYLLKPRMDAYIRACEIYADVDGGFGGKFSSRLKQCRKIAWFVQNAETKKLRVRSSRCKLRWCPICRDVQRMIVTRAVDEWLEVQKYPKMMTLTLRHSDDPLEIQINRIYSAFRKLRRRAYFQRLITGGVWFFQLKFNLRTEQWHPHIHCLVAGKFLPHTRLKELWRNITGDSYVVDIRPVKNLENASTEVARYATSPADLTTVNLEEAKTVHYATKHRRICGSWGTAKKVILKPIIQDDNSQWEKIADFYFINVQKEYSKVALEFWKCYQRGTPYEGPRVQPLQDVYADELSLLYQLEDGPEDYTTWRNRTQRNRAGPWTTFFGSIELETTESGYLTKRSEATSGT